MDGGEEIALGLIIAGGDGTELLEPGEEVFDQVSRLVEVSVVVARRLAVFFRRDHRGRAGRLQGLDDVLFGVERLIGDQRRFCQ